jgi:hypothetical protein
MSRWQCALIAAAGLFGLSGAACAEPGTGVGKWRWNGAESHYESGTYAKEQVMEITRIDASGIAVSQTVTLVDGKTFDWSIDSPWDNTMRKGSRWMSFAFARISDHEFKDRYRMAEGGQVGGETFTISPNRIVIRGSSHQAGHDDKKFHYVEIWDRIE